MISDKKQLLDEINILDSLSKNDRWDRFGKNLQILENELEYLKKVDLPTLKIMLSNIRAIEAKVALKKQMVEKEIAEIAKKKKLTNKYLKINSDLFRKS